MSMLLRAWRAASSERTALCFAGWLQARIRGLRPASARQYRAAALACLSSAFGDDDDLAAAEQVLKAARPGRTSCLPVRTSARKLKFLDEQDWERLSAWLRDPVRSGGARGPGRTVLVAWSAVEAWCRATLLCGLRPTEWSSVEVFQDDEGFVVRARNAKATHGRAHGETRSLVFPAITPEEREAIERTVALAHEWTARGKAAALQKLIADSLYRAGRAALGSREAYPSLYTFRHQAIANWKSERDVFEVAALCGHASIETANEHYAGRRRAWRGRRPMLARPSASDLEAVRRAVVTTSGPATPISFLTSKPA